MPSLRPRTKFALLAAALCGWGAAAYAARPPALPHQQFTFDAASSEFDYKAHTGSFEHIQIAQGKITVFADQAHATGLTEQNGQWVLVGHVRIHAPPHGSLNSDRAVVDVSNNRITRVTVTGSPARFKQQSATTGKVTQGHADQIVYDVKAGTVQLNQNAWVAIGRNQISGPTVLYNIVTERILATSQGAGERVHITIAPQAAPGKDGATKHVAPSSPAAPRGAPIGADTPHGKRRPSPPTPSGTPPHPPGRSF